MMTTSAGGPGMVSVVMGGNLGSEGKGEFIPYYAHLTGARHVVRTGGPNAGHTITTPHGIFKMRQIPCAWAQHIDLPGNPCGGGDGRPPVLYIGPGALIAPDVLINELKIISGTCYDWGIPVPNIFIDESAVIIDEKRHVTAEQATGMRGRIGSTTEGIGAARADHIMRKNSLEFAAEWFDIYFKKTAAYEVGIGPWTIGMGHGKAALAVVNVSEMLDTAIHGLGENVIIESTQGFGLSLVHSGLYPYATSRDVTPGIILNDAGLSSREKHEVIAVVRTMPIRVAGNSGPMHAETDWETLVAEIDHLEEPETTTVTGNPRRIAKEMDMDMMKKMVRHCRPDAICLTFLDYVRPKLYRCMDRDVIHGAAGGYLSEIEDQIGVPIKWVSTAPGCITEH